MILKNATYITVEYIEIIVKYVAYSKPSMQLITPVILPSIKTDNFSHFDKKIAFSQN